MRRGVEVVVQKYLTIILAFIIILSSFSPVIVYAATTDVKQENVNAADNGEEGYITATTINGATYKDYKFNLSCSQNAHSFNNILIMIK